MSLGSRGGRWGFRYSAVSLAAHFQRGGSKKIVQSASGFTYGIMLLAMGGRLVWVESRRADFLASACAVSLVSLACE